VSGRTAGRHWSNGLRLSPISLPELVDLAVSLHSRHGKELQRLDGATHRGVRVTSEHFASALRASLLVHEPGQHPPGGMALLPYRVAPDWVAGVRLLNRPDRLGGPWLRGWRVRCR
jgi:hypothetical protein